MSNRFHQTFAEVVQRVKLEGEGSSYNDVLDMLPELSDCIVIDQELAINEIRDIMSSSKDPLNALLGLFGLRILHVEKSLDHIEHDNIGGDSLLNRVLRIDRSTLGQTVQRISTRLRGIERSNYDDLQDKRDLLNETILELTQKRVEQTALESEMTILRKEIAGRVQYMLALLGEEDTSPSTQQLHELLADMQLSAQWRGDSIDLPESIMFTIVKGHDLQERKNKPCIIDASHTVICQGLWFVKEA